MAQSQPDLRRVRPEDHSMVLRLLSDRRDELTKERRRVVDRLHRLLRDLLPGGAPTELSTEAAAKLLDRVRPKTAVDLERKVRPVRWSPTCEGSTAPWSRTGLGARRPSPPATPRSRPSSVLAAKVLGHVGDVNRFGSADRFASYSGTAPIEVSSGEVTRHRLSRNGNRALNNALHLAARVQTMHAGPGRDHYARKLTEHKSSPEALRSLKRQLAKVVYRHLVADQAHRLALAP